MSKDDKQPETVRIDDLAQPKLSEMQRAAIAYGDGLNVELTAEAVMEQARTETGLSDFGPTDFVERLKAQLDSARDDHNASNLGQLTVFNDKKLNAANRLRVFELLRQKPEIDAIEIARPLIIVGLPRSGTTHLLNLLASDRRFRSMPYWESRQPVPSPGEPATRDESDPRFQRCLQAWNAQNAMLPLLKNMHPMTPEHIHEEIELQDIDFSSYTLEWIAHVPAWRDYYLAHDQTPHYQFLKRMLKVLSFYSSAARWVLKSPQHLEQLKPLMSAFPDAAVAITHRDPVNVIASAVTMNAYGSRLRYKHIDLPAIANYWIDRVERLLRAAVRDRELLPAERSIDILFPEFMADDLAMAKRVYSTADIELGEIEEASLKRFLAANPRGKHGRVVYDLSGDFKVDIDALRERFAFYYDRYPGLKENH